MCYWANGWDIAYSMNRCLAQCSLQEITGWSLEVPFSLTQQLLWVLHKLDHFFKSYSEWSSWALWFYFSNFFFSVCCRLWKRWYQYSILGKRLWVQYVLCWQGTCWRCCSNSYCWYSGQSWYSYRCCCSPGQWLGLDLGAYFLVYFITPLFGLWCLFYKFSYLFWPYKELNGLWKGESLSPRIFIPQKNLLPCTLWMLQWKTVGVHTGWFVEVWLSFHVGMPIKKIFLKIVW